MLRKPLFAFLLLASISFAANTTGSCGTLGIVGENYTLNQSVSINATNCFNVTAANVTLDCAGFSITGNNSTNSYGVSANQNNTVVKNCAISEFQHAILFNFSSGGTARNNSLNTTHGTGNAILLNRSNLTLVEGNTLWSANLSGVSLLSSNNSTIANNTGTTYSNNSASAAVIYLSASLYNVIDNNTGIAAGLCGGGAYLNSGSNWNNVTRNNLTTNGGGISCSPVFGSSANNNYVAGNTAYNSGNSSSVIPGYSLGIYFIFSSNGIIRDNRVAANSIFDWVGAIALFGSTGFLIANNTVNETGTAGGGITLIFSTSAATIMNNTVNSSGGPALLLWGDGTSLLNNTVTGNSLASASNSSIFAYDRVRNSTFANNTLASSGGAGTLVVLDGSSGNNTFYWNNFSATSGYYVNDSNGSNMWNASVNGQQEGNLWANVLDGSVSIAYSSSSSYGTNWHIGNGGEGYPYNSTNSLGKVAAGVVDYAPLFYAVPSPAPQTGGSLYIPTALSYSFNCSNGSLSISANSGATALSGIRIRLTNSGAFNPRFAATGTDGIAFFTITESGKYYAESQQSGAYSPAYISPFDLELCGQIATPAQPEQNYSVPPAEQGQNASNSTPQQPPPDDGKADAQASITDAETALASALKEGKDISGAAWRLSAAKAAYGRGDYLAAQKLAAEAEQLADSARARQPPMEEKSGGGPAVPSPPQQSPAIGFGVIAAIAIGIAIAGVLVYLFLLHGRRK